MSLSGFGGAKTLIRAGVLEGVSAIFGMHNDTQALRGHLRCQVPVDNMG